MYRESHNGEVRTFYLADSHVSDPFLDAIGSSLVIWLVSVYVIIDFLVCKVFELYYGSIAYGFAFHVVAYCYCSYYLVLSA